MSLEAVEVLGPVGPLGALDNRAAGPGVPVVFVHGINMAGEFWSGVIEALPQPRRAVAVDLRGHGRSVRTGPFDAADYADDVVAVMDALTLDQVHIVGTSFGGPVACTVASRTPERVASITSIGSAVSAKGAVDVEGGIDALRQVGPRDFFRGFLTQASFAPGTDPALIEHALDAAASNDVDTIAEIVRTAFGADASDVVAQVKAPALVITGEYDLTCPVPAGEELAAALGTQLRVQPGRGHLTILEDPSGVASVIAPHLAANDPR